MVRSWRRVRFLGHAHIHPSSSPISSHSVALRFSLPPFSPSLPGLGVALCWKHSPDSAVCGLCSILGARWCSWGQDGESKLLLPSLISARCPVALSWRAGEKLAMISLWGSHTPPPKNFPLHPNTPRLLTSSDYSLKVWTRWVCYQTSGLRSGHTHPEIQVEVVWCSSLLSVEYCPLVETP